MGRQAVIPHRSARLEAEKSDEDGAQQLVGPVRCRQVSRFWLEKALVLIDGAQLFALMWQLSQPWPWPARWLEATRSVNIFTIDLFSFRETGAAMGSTSQSFSLWGEMDNYWLYALLWALVPWSGVLVLQVAKRVWVRQGRSDFLTLSVQWENVLLQILQFLFVPVGLAVLRLVNCNADGAVSVDPRGMSCGSAGHVAAVLLVTCGLGGGFLLGLPWMLPRCIRGSLVHSSLEKHERFVQGKELEFMLGTSDTYLELYLPLFASFQRHSVEMSVQMCWLKLTLMLVFSVLRSPPPSMANQGLQGSFFFLVVVGMAVFRTWRHPYRCASTSYLAILVDWMLVANGIFVLLCANGVRSALTVSTSVTSSLVFLNLLFLVVISFMSLRDVALLILRPQSARAKGLYWPTNEGMKEIVEYGTKVASWVKAIHSAQSIILSSLLAIPSMRPCGELKSTLDQVELCYEEAAGTDHLLMSQLYELSLYVNELYVEAVASNPFHPSGFPAKELADLSGVLQRRKERQILVSTRSQRVLKKLHITRSWSHRGQPHAVANAGWSRKHSTSRVQEFLDTESECHQAAPTALATDWESVNSVFCLKSDCDPDSNSSVLLISVLSWSPSFRLVKWCRMQDASLAEKAHEQYFSLQNAKVFGIEGEVVSCGDASNTAAVLGELTSPVVSSDRREETEKGSILQSNSQTL